MKPTTFLTDLKRRDSWFLTQFTPHVLPFFEIPNPAVRFLVIAMGAGFPIAMLLAWLCEFTPKESCG